MTTKLIPTFQYFDKAIEPGFSLCNAVDCTLSTQRNAVDSTLSTQRNAYGILKISVVKQTCSVNPGLNSTEKPDPELRGPFLEQRVRVTFELSLSR